VVAAGPPRSGGHRFSLAPRGARTARDVAPRPRADGLARILTLRRPPAESAGYTHPDLSRDCGQLRADELQQRRSSSLDHGQARYRGGRSFRAIEYPCASQLGEARRAEKLR